MSTSHEPYLELLMSGSRHLSARSSNDIHEIINYCLEQITIVNTLCHDLSSQTSAQAH